jgi:hypothetical protein
MLPVFQAPNPIDWSYYGHLVTAHELSTGNAILPNLAWQALTGNHSKAQPKKETGLARESEHLR